jgi:hypothetical protein
MVEVDDVIVQRVADQDQIADVLRVGRDVERERIFDCAHGGDGVDGSADSAEALREDPAFAGITSTQNLFQSAPHGAAGPGLVDLAAIDFDVDAQMAFDASYGID